MFNIEEELKKLPSQPGVYIMHDAKDEIIYVGKAVSLKNRVRQYFQSSRGKSAKIEQMVSRIARFEYIVTDSEMEALVLECNLIKEHRPRYNTMLKDDKAYPYIKVTVGEEFPRVMFARTMKKDKSKYFGPDTIDLIHKLYKIRTCNRSLPRDIGKDRPCLNYHIKQCDAPCQGYIDREAYAENIRQALEFLNGRYDNLIGALEEKMKSAAGALDFEKAAEYRGRINEKLEEILRHLAADRNLPVLKLLAEEGFFSAENIEGCIKTLERAGEREMMLWLMNWKNQEIGSDAFDFSL